MGEIADERLVDRGWKEAMMPAVAQGAIFVPFRLAH
jgi:hypothetical protein